MERRDELESVLEFSKSLAKEAGALIARMRFEGELGGDFKRGVELVTRADLASSELICRSIAERYPNHRILSEEAIDGHRDTYDLTRPLWVIDPIDGTVNYATGNPLHAISIAYCDSGNVQVGVVFCPHMDELFFSTRGGGAYLNDQAIRVGRAERLKDAVVATGFPHGWDGLQPLFERLARVRSNCRDIRRSGTAAIDLAWLACGRIDAYYEYKVSPWDVAAGRLIAREAGAHCGFFEGNEEGNDIEGRAIVNANPAIFDALRSLL